MTNKEVGFEITFLFCLAALAVSGADKVVTSKELGFEITFPEAWKVNASGASADSPVPEGAHSYVTFSVHVSNVAEGTTLKDFVSGEQKKMTLGGAVAVGWDDEVRLDCARARKVSYPYKSASHIRLVHYYAISGNRAYTLVIDWLDYDDHIHGKDIDAIVKSFKLIEAK